MPPSITFWNRLEPRPRANSIAESLAARVRDPLWLLARQWQVGEFAAADCGSPIYVDLQGQTGPISGWMAASAATGTPWTGAAPMESEIESEPFTPDLATRVELGQWFETLIGANPGDRMIDDLRAEYPLPLVIDGALDRAFSYTGSLTGLDGGTMPASLDAAFRASSIVLSAPDIWPVTSGSQWVISDRDFGTSYAIVATGPQAATVHLCRDGETLRFLRVCAGHACDGVAIINAARSGGVILPARPEWTAQQASALADAGTTLASAVSSVFGAIGGGDPPSWSAPHAAFELSVGATVAGTSLDVLRATAGPHGEFDWTSFDLNTPNGQMNGVATQPSTSLSLAVMPGHVRFRGMPNARWWEFETTETDFGGIQPEKRDLAKLIFMDFMLIHGDDWYLVPVDVPVGSIAQITGLFVHDTFGVVTRIDRADAVAGTSTTTPGQQWTMFSPTWSDHAPEVGSYLVVPATIWPTALSSRAIEEVRLVRDPVADMVWGVESIVESAIGHPWPGRERDAGGKPSRSPKPVTGPGAATMDYRLHTAVPVNWIPFVAVAQGATGGYALQRAVLPGDDVTSVRPAGRLLQLAQLREQEVSTQGTVLSRVVYRSRWIDGSTRLWISRRRGYGTGTGSSGLRFDVATADVGH